MLHLTAPPTSVFILDIAGDYPSSGGIAYLIDGRPHWFQCRALDIDTQAFLTWTLDGQNITWDDGSSVEISSDGWTNQTSNLTVSVTESQHDQVLRCRVSNEDGQVAIGTSVKLYVKG